MLKIRNSKKQIPKIENSNTKMAKVLSEDELIFEYLAACKIIDHL